MTKLNEREFERILLIKPSALGDVIHAIPVLAKLRTRYPKARIDWLLTPQNADLIRHHPALSNVVEFDRGRYAKIGRDWSATLGPARLAMTIRANRYDLVVDLHGQFRSALLALASGARTRIGFDKPRKNKNTITSLIQGKIEHGWSGAREGAWLAYTHRIALPTLDAHAVDRYLWVGELLGFDKEPADFSLVVPQAAQDRIDRRLDAAGFGVSKPLAVIVPCTIWATKHWHVEGFADTARRFIAEGFGVVLAGTIKDMSRCREIADRTPGAIDLSGETSVSELAALIRRATICVTNDSGSMHLAVALDRPVVSVFGPTDPARIGPYGRPGSVVRADIACSPCHLRRLSDCHHGHLCMKSISGANVHSAAKSVLAASRSAYWNEHRQAPSIY